MPFIAMQVGLPYAIHSTRSLALYCLQAWRMSECTWTPPRLPRTGLEPVLYWRSPPPHLAVTCVEGREGSQAQSLAPSCDVAVAFSSWTPF